MESKLKKGLYLIGELLDVDGICGGIQSAMGVEYRCDSGNSRRTVI